MVAPKYPVDATVGASTPGTSRTATPGPKPVTRVLNEGIRYYDPPAFANRYTDDQGDFEIEVLQGGDSYINDLMDGFTFGKTEATRKISLPSTHPKDGLASTREGRSDPNSMPIRCVRIRSPHIITSLWQCISNTDDRLYLSSPCIFSRPFRVFFYYQSAMEERLKTYSEVRSPFADAAVKAIRTYLNFVRHHIIPLQKAYDVTKTLRPQSILFDDLWYLFRPGMLIYVPPDNQITDESPWEVYRVHRVDCEPVWKQLDASTQACFSVQAYRLSYDGKVYGFQQHPRPLTISSFQQKENIDSLPFYPLDLHPGRDRILKELEATRKFQISVLEEGGKHAFYSGWTLPEVADGASSKDLPPRYVEDDVILDYKEAWKVRLESAPRLLPIPVPRLQIDEAIKTRRERVPGIAVWNSRTGERVSKSHDEYLAALEDEILALWESHSWMLKSKRVGIEARSGRSIMVCEEEDKILLPRCIYGYILRERRFALLHVLKCRLHDYSGGNSALDLVRLKPSYRQLIRSAVSSHLMLSERRKKYGETIMPPDISRGKGRGLLVLLQGPPGVGKTATAEAVAMECRKPLFTIPCGDLVSTPDTIKTLLNTIFRLAQLWDCILILDEADVFVSQRDMNDLNRNALVSVFIRALEYYPGIIFLATNREGTLDGAFTSRVHVNLHYPHLGIEDSMAILKSHLSSLEEAEEQREDQDRTYKSLKVMRREIEHWTSQYFAKHERADGKVSWDGRQIRNAVQTAAGLAFYDQKTQRPDEKAILTPSHFKTIAHINSDVEKSLTVTRGRDDSFRAWQHEERDDGYNSELRRLEDSSYSGTRRHEVSNDPSESNRYHIRPDSPQLSYEFNDDDDDEKPWQDPTRSQRGHRSSHGKARQVIDPFEVDDRLSRHYPRSRHDDERLGNQAQTSSRQQSKRQNARSLESRLEGKQRRSRMLRDNDVEREYDVDGGYLIEDRDKTVTAWRDNSVEEEDNSNKARNRGQRGYDGYDDEGYGERREPPIRGSRGGRRRDKKKMMG